MTHIILGHFIGYFCSIVSIFKLFSPPGISCSTAYIQTELIKCHSEVCCIFSFTLSTHEKSSQDCPAIVKLAERYYDNKANDIQSFQIRSNIKSLMGRIWTQINLKCSFNVEYFKVLKKHKTKATVDRGRLIQYKYTRLWRKWETGENTAEDN